MSAQPSQRKHFPRAMARCAPTRLCRQHEHCARAQAPKSRTAVDASICLQAGWCPMFIDVRGTALQLAHVIPIAERRAA